jgi:hypothetical protein
MKVDTDGVDSSCNDGCIEEGEKEPNANAWSNELIDDQILIEGNMLTSHIARLVSTSRSEALELLPSVGSAALKSLRFAHLPSQWHLMNSLPFALLSCWVPFRCRQPHHELQSSHSCLRRANQYGRGLCFGEVNVWIDSRCIYAL